VSDVKRAAELEAIRRRLVPLTAYRQLLNGPELVSDWLLVDQSMIDTFADATNEPNAKRPLEERSHMDF
jgi:hypothetical protein